MIARPRLHRLLAAEPAPALVAVIAPPGYGKSVLLAEWAARRPNDVAWLTLDEHDNAPSVLLTYIAAALDRVHPIDPEIGRALSAPGTRILSAAVPRLASELFHWGRPGALVLDDLHRIVDRTCLDALAMLVEHLPPGFQVVVASRTVPDLPLASLRAKRTLLEVGRDDLAFDADEALALAASIGVPLDPEEAAALASRTEGWAAAIFLASLARQRADRGDGMATEVSGRDGYIAGYLRSELGPVVDAEDLAVLRRTTVPEVIEPGLAERVSGTPDATERLRRLARSNLLISEIGAPTGAFRLHHLLRDYLADELERREPGTAAGLHHRAATWYADQGRTEVAIEHALATGDPDFAGRLIEAATLQTYERGHSDRLGGWLDALPSDVFERRPALAFGAALVHALNGRADAAEHMADAVERATFDEPPGNGAASLESMQAMLAAILVRNGAEAALASAAVAAAAEGPRSPWWTLALEVLADAHLMCGNADAAAAALDNAIAAAPTGGSYGFYGHALRASVAVARGEWHQAERYAREALVRVARLGAGMGASAIVVHGVAARIALHHGDVAHGREALVQAQLLRPLASRALPAVAVHGLIEVARAYLAIADPAGAGRALAEAEAILRHRPGLGVYGEQLAALRQRTHASAATLVGPSTLTPAELRLLPLLSTHLMFQDIADRLGVSRHTVKTQVVSIYGKLGASSRGEAIERAIEVGLLEPFPGLRLVDHRRPD